MDIEELTAREGIRELVARYNFYGDRGQSREVASLFTPDGVLIFRSGDVITRSVGQVDIENRLEAFKNDFAVQLQGSRHPGRIFHHTSTHIIDFVDSSHAKGRAYVSVIAGNGLLEWGEYIDHYSKLSHGWRISSREARKHGAASH